MVPSDLDRSELFDVRRHLFGACAFPNHNIGDHQSHCYVRWEEDMAWKRLPVQVDVQDIEQLVSPFFVPVTTYGVPGRRRKHGNSMIEQVSHFIAS
jgi:hypothetical protein